MKENKEKEIKKDTTIISPEKELKALVRLSPTSINSWYKCPRSFFYSYIEKQPTAPSIALVKGSLVHKVLENFYKVFRASSDEYFEEEFDKEWKKQADTINKLELTPEEYKKEKEDTYNMILDYNEMFKRKVKALMIAGKVENERHAFYLLRPKFREMWVEDKELKCAGFIDRVDKGFDGMITLGDYKTSSKYGIGLPESFKRQLSIYGLLYNRTQHIMPNFVSIIFLRYGEEYILEVTPSLLKYARNTIDNVWSRTRSVSISDYPMHEGILCGWCPFKDICSGEQKYKETKSKESIKKLFDKKEKK